MHADRCNLISVFINILLSFIFSAIVVRICIHLAPKFKLLAVPGEHRSHDVPTPVVGGIAVFISICFISQLLGISFSQYSYLFLAYLGLLVIGAVDDIFHLSSASRFIVQIICAWIIVAPGGTELHSLGNLFSDSEALLGSLSRIFTVFAIIGVINAANMTDGLDGLLGGQFVLIFSGLLFVSVLSNYSIDIPIFYALITSLLAFLCFNLRIFGRLRARVFLGDAGSMSLGLLVSWFLIRYSQSPLGLIDPVTALWFVAVPLSDTISVMFRRILQKRSPFDADRTHLHHLLLHKGLSVNGVLGLLLLFSFTLLIVGLMLELLDVPEFIRFYIAIGIFVLHMTITNKYVQKHGLSVK